MPRPTEIPHHRNSKKRVQRILSQERHFRNGPPHWLEGKKKRPCQTTAEAQIERRKTVKRLRRFGKENSEALALASRLEACAPRQRCGSGACPECARAWQRWFVIAIRNFLESEPRRPVTVLNPIHVSGKIEPGSLCDPNVLENAREAIRAALIDARIPGGAFGLDISFNEDRDGGFEPHWQLHLRGLIVGRISQRRKSRFWSHFPKSSEIPKPRRSGEWDGDLSGIAYSMKPILVRREPPSISLDLCVGGATALIFIFLTLSWTGDHLAKPSVNCLRSGTRSHDTKSGQAVCVQRPRSSMRLHAAREKHV